MKYRFLFKGASTKIFAMFTRFWFLRGWVEGEEGFRWVWVNLLKKEHLWRKSFYQTFWNEILEICKKWHLLMLKLQKLEIKDLVAVSYKFLKEIPSKLETQCKRRHVFFIWFWFVFYPFWYCTLRVGVDGGFLLNIQKSVTHGKRYLSTVPKILFNFKKKILASFNKGKPSKNPFNITTNQELELITSCQRVDLPKTSREQLVESNSFEKF